MITVFALINLFTSFLLRKLNSFVGFINPVVKKSLIHMRSLMAAPALPILHVIDRTTVQTDTLRKSLGG